MFIALATVATFMIVVIIVMATYLSPLPPQIISPLSEPMPFIDPTH
jgi:hypothetical protein